MRKNVLVQSLSFLLWMTILTGVLYPAFVTLAAGLAFRDKAGGSLIRLGGEVRGSRLLAQDFGGGPWFLARPSATDWATLPSGASNLAATNPGLAKERAANVAAWAAASGFGKSQAPASPIPPDMAASSASGLDPDISSAAAEYQVARVAAARGISVDAVRAAVARHTEQPLLGFLGEARVHVLELNLDLDGLLTTTGASPAVGA